MTRDTARIMYDSPGITHEAAEITIGAPDIITDAVWIDTDRQGSTRDCRPIVDHLRRTTRHA